MSVKVPDLETIRRRAEANAFSLDELGWERGVARDRMWFPERMTPLAHTEVYGELGEEERLTYNHFYAQAVNEQFIFLEEWFLVRVVEGVRRRKNLGVPEDLRVALDDFLAEEMKHTAMFRRLNLLADPERYAKGEFSFMRFGWAEDKLLDLMAWRPEMLVVWCWMALIFEEKTIDYYRQYQRHDRERASEPLDPLHTEVHRYHAIDEVRHVQVDHHLVEHFHDRCGGVVRAINARLLARTLAGYTRPRRTNFRIVEELGRAHPRLAARVEAMKEQLRGLFARGEWQAIAYSRRNAPQTFAQFDRHPELHRLSQVLTEYRPQAA